MGEPTGSATEHPITAPQSWEEKSGPVAWLIPPLPTEALLEVTHPQGNCWAGKLSQGRHGNPALAGVNFLISLLGYLWRKTRASVPLTTLHSQQEGLPILESIGTLPRKYSHESTDSSLGGGQRTQAPRAQGVCGVINSSGTSSTSAAPPQGDKDCQHLV